MNSVTNNRFVCACNLPIGTCRNFNHPLKMEALVGPFVEGWALGKYSGKLEDKSTQTHTQYGYLKYGQLVHDFKYASFKLNQSEGEVWRRSIMDQLKISVDYFLEGYFPKAIRPFDTVVPVPSSSDSSETIQNKIAIHLREKGLNEAQGTIKVDNRGHISTKNIPGLQGRLKSVGTRYGLGAFNELQSARGLLLIDDVYETGATLRTTVSLLNQVVPEIPKYFLTIAYIR
jgi:predicted amidophosphoribosyltransferase